MVSTSTPQNEAELQLYRVLQRASLLAYYDTLLEMGKIDANKITNFGNFRKHYTTKKLNGNIYGN